MLLVAQNYLSVESFTSLIERIYEKRYIIRDTSMSLQELKELIIELKLDYAPPEDDFMKDAVIIDSVRDIVSTTLKGNPRQAKRFLNTFVTKRILAQMYYDQDVDIRILAKILVLQKLDSRLFNQLNEWNKDFKLSNEQFKKMYDEVLSGSNNVDYSRWSTPSLKKWLECEPKDLFNQRLDKYFYLTRENLKKNIINPQDFSSEARKLLERFGTSTRGTISGIIKDMKELTLNDINDVFSVLIPKIENGQIEFFIIKELFIEFEEYREKTLLSITKSKRTVRAPDIIYLKQIYEINSKDLSPILEAMKADNRLTQKMYNRIIGEEN